jgi:hypothetical protein
MRHKRFSVFLDFGNGLNRLHRSFKRGLWRGRSPEGKAMVSLQYKGRIHKAKFTMRSIRYILSDQAARLFPSLQRRWLLPVESRPISEAASADLPLPSAIVDAAVPDCLAKLEIAHPRPLQLVDHIYSLDGVLVTGWAGATVKDGLLLAVRPQQNWASALRAHPHRVRGLSSQRPYFNLMAPIPARGHIFHWLFNSMIPLLAFLENGGRDLDLGLIVNGARSEFQDRTIDYLKDRYGITAIEPVGQRDAIEVPHLKVAIPVPHIPRALQSPLGLAVLDDLGRFIGQGAAQGDSPKRIYVSRSDARLRRVLNEDSIVSALEAQGFRRVVLAALPIARQVQLFRQAEVILAPHGAGLAHIAWCKQGTKIVEFLPSPGGQRGKVKNASSDYWLISQLRGLSYAGYLAGPIETRSDGFAIAEELLALALREVLAASG